MQDDHAVGGRQSPGERAAAALESMPRVRPVEPVLAQQFTGILNGARRAANGFKQEGAQVEGTKWEKLKRQGFLMAGHMLNAEAVSRQGDGKQNSPGKQGTFPSDETEVSDAAGAAAAGGRRLPILRLGSMLLADNDATEFVNELAEFIGQGRNFGSAWHLEILLSSEQLSQTRLLIDCDETRLRLRFICANLGAHQLLEKNIALLQGMLSALSMRPVLLEIAAVADAGAESGIKGPA